MGMIKKSPEIQDASPQDAPKCPKCGGDMVIRRSRFGKLFYGCASYPNCNGIVNLK
jgi:DNA topoisomerase-1